MCGFQTMFDFPSNLGKMTSYILISIVDSIFEAGAELRRILKDRSEALFPQLGDEGHALRLNLRKVLGGRMFDFSLYTLQKNQQKLS